MTALEYEPIEAMIGAVLQQHEGISIPANPKILEYRGTRFTLARPIEVTVSEEDGVWIYRSSELGIESFGTSRPEAELSFYEDFAVLYEHLGCEADKSLTPEAQRVKQAFLDIVVAVAAVA